MNASWPAFKIIPIYKADYHVVAENLFIWDMATRGRVFDIRLRNRRPESVMAEVLTGELDVHGWELVGGWDPLEWRATVRPKR